MQQQMATMMGDSADVKNARHLLSSQNRKKGIPCGTGHEQYELFRLGATTYLTSEPRGFPPQGTDLLSTIFNKRLRWVVTVSCLAVF